MELFRELLESPLCVGPEDVLDDADLRVVVEGHVHMRRRDEVDRDAAADRAAHGDPDGLTILRRGQQEERGGKDRARPLLRVAEEAPGPLPRSDPASGQVGQLVLHRVELSGHQVEKHALGEPKRRPVEVVMRDEPRMALAAAAVEVDLEDGRVRRARQLLDPPERRERDPGLPPVRAREGVPRRERVVHDSVVIGRSDEK